MKEKFSHFIYLSILIDLIYLMGCMGWNKNSIFCFLKFNLILLKIIDFFSMGEVESFSEVTFTFLVVSTQVSFVFFI